jgi:hypothetical protein
MSILSELMHNLKRFSDRRSLTVVHDDDLESLLSDLGFLDDIVNGTVTCSQCGAQVGLGNLGGWAKLGSQLVLFCDATNCLDNVSALASKNDEGHEQHG